MPSTVYRSHTHRTSWESAPSYHKYAVGQYAAANPGQSSQSILKKVRKTLCGMFASLHSPTKNANNSSVDSLAYAQSDDDSVFEAESIDEDNMAWGRPSKRSKHHRNTQTHMRASGSRSNRNININKEASSIPSSPDSTQAACRLW
ncbi:hypothetical protein ACEPAG_1301 [Sanghuangporus baumii]